MEYTVESAEVHIALDDQELLDSINIGDVISLKEYPTVAYTISEEDMEIMNERSASSIIFLGLKKSKQGKYETTRLRIYSL